MALADLDEMTVPVDMTPAQSGSVGSRVFTSLADGKISDQHIHRFLATGALFLTETKARHADDPEAWADALRKWTTSVRALESDALRIDMREVDELTEEHHDLVMDPSRNTVFNYGGCRRLLTDYLKKHPGLRIPNMMGGTLLYAARPGCRHASDGRLSGVGCKHCPGWFCF